MGPMPMNRRSRLVSSVVMISGALCMMAVAGCGGGGSSSAASSGGASSGGGSAQVSKFQACLREHGVEGFGQGQPTQPSDEDRASLQEAMNACRDLAPQGAGTGGFPGADSAQFAEYRECLQKNGASGLGFGGPPPQGGTGQPSGSAPDGQPGGGPALSDEERAKLTAAMEACRSLAPEGFGQRGGGLPGPGGANGNGAVANPEYRKCMADHGVTLGEPGSVGTEAFRKATEACGRLLDQSDSGSAAP